MRSSDIEINKTTTYTALGITNSPCCECDGTEIGMRYMKITTTFANGEIRGIDRYPIDEACRKRE